MGHMIYTDYDTEFLNDTYTVYDFNFSEDCSGMVASADHITGKFIVWKRVHCQMIASYQGRSWEGV